MPIHDWKKPEAGLFHNFHAGWVLQIKNSLNGILPPDYYALVERSTDKRRVPDVLTLQSSQPAPRNGSAAATLTLEKPKISLTNRLDWEADSFRRRMNHVAVRGSNDRLVAIVEVLSPGNKSSDRGFRKFLAKVIDLLEQGVHVLLIDVHKPTSRDPRGIHDAVLRRMSNDSYSFPAGKNLTFASYDASGDVSAYVVPAAVGDVCPEMPLFLEAEGCVHIPLEQTYLNAWNAEPKQFHEQVENPQKA